jgi:hypothetical protein
MSIIKEQIKFIGTDMFLNFGLTSSDSFLGFQQEIDNLTSVVSVDLINPAIDLEERKFRYSGSTDLLLQFQFYNIHTSQYTPFFTAAGFSTEDIDGNSTSKLNSFFIADFYNSYDINTQVKIFRTYLTKLGYTPYYTIGPNTSNQLYSWYIPVDYINSQTGTTVTGYTRFMFYNAISGITTLFYNNDNVALTTPEKMYFKSVLDLKNKTWRIITPSFPIALGKELIGSLQYTKKVNDTVINFNNEVQNYPVGSKFNYLTGTYSNL